MFFPIIILFIISSAGLILHLSKKINTTLLTGLIALGAGSMLALSLTHILPEALEQSEYAIYAFLAGFIIIYLIEELLTPHSHDHKHLDHVHEDPHEHFDHIVIVSCIAIFFHTVFDGLGIRASFGLSEALGYSVLIGVAIHQIPVSLSLAALFRKSHFSKQIQILGIILFALAAPIGYILSDLLIDHLDTSLTSLITAFAGGSLLYIATSDLLPVIHSTTKKKYLMISLFLIGVIGMSSAHLLEGHEHDEGHEIHGESSH
jgi:zinc transporter ZupT